MFASGILLHEALDGRRLPVPGSALALLALVTGVSTMLVPAEGSGGYLLKVGVLFGALFALTLIPAAALFLLVERPFSLAPRRTRGADERGVPSGISLPSIQGLTR